MSRRFRFLSSVAVVGMLSVSGCLGANAVRSTSKTVTIPKDFKSVAFSPDGRRVGFGVEKDGQARAVIDGQPESPYENVSVVAFSPSGKHYYYGGKRDGKWHLVEDGKEIAELGSLTSLVQGTGLHEIGPGSISVIGWSSLAIWFATETDNYMVLCYKDSTGRVFKDGKWLPVDFRSFWHEGMAFSRNGQHYCFAVSPAGSRSAHMYTDGEMGQSGYDGIDSATYLQPGDRLVYRAKRGNTWSFVSTDKSLEDYGATEGTIIASKDRQHFAVLVDAAGGQQAVVVDGRKGPAFPKVDWAYSGFLSRPGSFTWSRDCSSYAYAIHTSAGKSPDEEKAPMAVVHNGKRLKPHTELRATSIALSPDGKHVAYAAKVGEEWAVVVDQTAGQSFEDVGDPVFVVPGNRVIHAAKTSEGWTIQGLDDCGPFLAVSPVLTSPDSSHVIFAAKQTEKQWRVFADSKPISASFDAIIRNVGIRIEEDGNIRFVGKNGNQLVWVETRGS